MEHRHGMKWLAFSTVPASLWQLGGLLTTYLGTVYPADVFKMPSLFMEIKSFRNL